MKWTQYPTQADKDSQRNGYPVQGIKWAEAPGPGNVYGLPEGCESRTRNLVIVNTRLGVSTSVGPLPDNSTARLKVCAICRHISGDTVDGKGPASDSGRICRDRNACQQRAADRLAGGQ